MIGLVGGLGVGAEWLVVLGSVLAVSERGRHALEASHQRLVLAQDDLRRLADRDPLTGAINRRALREVFNTVHGSGAMLLFFDLDGFKTINDVHGHAAGDTCLQKFASALKESFRPDDHVIRYGGDEFAALCPETSGEAMAHALRRLESNMPLGPSLRGRLAKPLGISWGAASFPADANEEGELIRIADDRLYDRKRSRRRE